MIFDAATGNDITIPETILAMYSGDFQIPRLTAQMGMLYLMFSKDIVKLQNAFELSQKSRQYVMQ